MPGRMGGNRIAVQNLLVMRIDKDRTLFVRHVPEWRAASCITDAVGPPSDRPAFSSYQERHEGNF